MARSRFTLVAAERFAVAATVLVGWFTVVDQAIHDGFPSGGGTLWLALFAAGATGGAAILFASRHPHQHGLRALGLALTALSPTVFAYILNIALVVLAVIELALTVAAKRRPRQMPSTR
jgi:hypothetical protein